MNITRRHGLLAAAASAVGALAGAGAAFGQPAPVRKAIEELSPDELQLFHDAVRDMRANEHYADPRSWMYWAWIHDYRLADVQKAVADNKLSRTDALALTGLAPADFDHVEPYWEPPAKRAGANRAWSRCPHHTPDMLFLPWHRSYLLYFEEVLRSYARAIDPSRGDALRLPYFDPFASRGAIPRALTQQFLDNGAQNALWHPNRKTALDPNTLNAARINGLQAALQIATQGGRIDAFSAKVESPAHDQVHGLNGADMGSTLTAGRDPMFWLHHANVDRQWVVLDRDGTKSTLSNPAWQAPMPFRMSASDIRQPLPSSMSSAAGLGAGAYAYSDETHIVRGQAAPATPTPAPRRPRQRLSAAANAAVLTRGAITLSERRDLRVQGEEVALQFGVAGRNQAQLRAGIAGAPAPGAPNARLSATLVLEDVRLAQDDNASFFLVAVRPPGGADALDPLIVGALSRWEIEMAQQGVAHDMAMPADAHRGATLRFSLSDRPALAAAVGADFEVWFLPADDEARQSPGFTIGSARVELSNAPAE